MKLLFVYLPSNSKFMIFNCFLTIESIHFSRLGISVKYTNLQKLNLHVNITASHVVIVFYKNVTMKNSENLVLIFTFDHRTLTYCQPTAQTTNT